MRLEPEVYAGLPVAGNGATLTEVTIRRLLSQRSGLPDYFEGKTVDGSPNLQNRSRLNRTVWTPLELDYT